MVVWDTIDNRIFSLLQSLRSKKSEEIFDQHRFSSNLSTQINGRPMDRITAADVGTVFSLYGY